MVSTLQQVVDQITAQQEPEASPELWALAEKICAQAPRDESTEEWAKRLASELIDADDD